MADDVESRPEEDTSDPTRTFFAAPLTCEPFYRDWGILNDKMLHVYGAEIVPKASCGITPLMEEACVAPTALTVKTGKWGDVVSLFDGDDPDAPQPDFNDISAIVEKFLADPTAPIKAQAQLQPNAPDPSVPVDFKDIAKDVEAFVGTPYYSIFRASENCECPPAVVCGGITCTTQSDCGDGYCVSGFCTDECRRCSDE